MTAFGTFLRQMGTAIYSTRAWAVYGEGPTKLGSGEFTTPTALTASDIRYTASKDGDAVYAILGGWPGNGKQVTMTSVTTSRFALGTGKVFLFGPTGGSPIELTAMQDGSGLHVTLPSAQPYTALAYAIKISKSGTAPAPTPWLTSVSATDGGVATGGTTGGAGGGGMGGAGGAAAGTGGTTPTGGVGGAAAGAGGTRGTGGANATGGAGGAGGVATGGKGAGGTVAGSGGTGDRGATGSGGNTGSGTGGATIDQSGSASGCSCATGAGETNAAGILVLGFSLVLTRRRRRFR